MTAKGHSFLLLFILPLLAFSQPEMSVWKVDHKSDIPILPHSSSHGAELWNCDFDYYFDYQGDNVEHEIILHVLNEGTDTLEVNSTDLVNGSQGYEIDLLGLTGTIKIAPNHELQIIVKFIASSYSNQSDQLVISSNDLISPSCEFSFEVGIALNFDIADPCSCDNIISATNAFGYLFRDTLLLTTSGGMLTWNLVANNNLNGFVDMTGSPIMPPLNFGTTNGDTIRYVFYRFPNEVVNIDLNAGNFTSTGSCAGTCVIPTTPSIPTLSQWGIIILFIILMCIGVVGIQSKIELIGANP